MDAIRVESLRRTFAVKEKGKGPKAAFRSMLKPSYRAVEAVKGLTFSVEKGEAVAFLGPNGAGKSTTIKMLTGILRQDSGSVSVLGLDPSSRREELAYRIGSVFGQKSQLWFHLPADDTFDVLGAIYGVPRAALSKRKAMLVERFGIGDLVKVPVRKLSLGERMRCEIAASLLHAPEALFLDEPTIGLDVVVKQEIRKLLTEVNREEGVTLFLTSHDLGDIERVCKRAIIIHHGSIIVDSPMKDLRRRALSRKIVGVKYAEPAHPELPGIEATKRTEFAARFEIDTERHPIAEVLKKLSECGEVEDITIEDEPLETLIAGVYRSASEEEAHEKAGRAAR